MTKQELVESIALKTNVPKWDVLATLDALFVEVKQSLADGEAIFIRGFGSFQLKRRMEMTSRNIRAKRSVIIPEHMIPYFKPSPDFLALVHNVPVNNKPESE